MSICETRLMRRHPARTQLYAYAEALCQSRRPAIEPAVARHVKTCVVCHREVSAMLRTLKTVEAAQPLEPGRAFTAQLMQRARQERQEREKRAALFRAWSAWGKGLAYAACLLVFAGVWFGGASGPAAKSGGSQPQQGTPSLMLGSNSPQELNRAAERVDSLSRAVTRVEERMPRGGGPGWEAKYRSAVGILDADLEEALAAMQRNPGYARTNELVHANLERQVQTLKSLYLGRSL
ncbi:MAG: hypothetical protein ACLFV4_05605 [Candidatus Hydrogenedentota bacterium]